MEQSQQEHYSGEWEEYQLVMPLEVGLKIGEDEPVRLLSRVIKEMDSGKLNAASNRSGQKGKATPKHLLKVTLYGYMNGRTSTRKHAFLDDPQSSVIEITARGGGGRLIICVRDNGRGMPPERLKEVLDSLTQPRAEDAGMGLSNVYCRLAIAAKGDCRMDIESREGEGTVVTLEMPLRMEEAQR